MSEARFRRSICLDFDGVIHHHTSPFLSANRVADGPTPGAMEALRTYTEHFVVSVYSGRTGKLNGIYAMQRWLLHCLIDAFGFDEGRRISDLIIWPHEKPLAFVSLDDRAITFTGEWPTVERLSRFQPWNKGGRVLSSFDDEDLLNEIRDRGYVLSGYDA